MSLPPIDRLLVLDDRTLHDFRDHLANAGYTHEVLGRAETVGAGLLDPLRVPLVRDALRREGTAAAHAARLFAYEDRLSEADAIDALGGDRLRQLLDAGVLAIDPGDAGGVHSLFRFVPVDGIYFLSDPMESGGEAVMGPGQITWPLARMARASRAASVLDVGCGAGTMALFAARRGAEAVGVDINPRAIDIARWNARLNGLRAHFEAGDLLAPVRGRRFELLLSQPPFVMRPAETTSVTCLHGGAYGDELGFRLLNELPSVLAPHGLAVVFMDSATRPGQSFHHRVREAIGAAPIDLVALLASGMTLDVQSIAYGYLEDSTFGTRFAETAVRYRRHLEGLGVPGFHHAYVVLRAGETTRTEPSFSIQLQIRSASAIHFEHLEALFVALDLAACPDAELERAALTLPDGASWIEERPRPDATLEPICRVRFAPQNPFVDQELPHAAFALVEFLDQSDNIAEAIVRYAAACECAPEEVRDQVLNFVREGLSRGILWPR